MLSDQANNQLPYWFATVCYTLTPSCFFKPFTHLLHLTSLNFERLVVGHVSVHNRFCGMSMPVSVGLCGCFMSIMELSGAEGQQVG